MLWWCWSLWLSWCLHSAFVENCYEKREYWLVPWWWTRHITKFSGPEIEQKRKQIIQIFKSCGLNITVKTNLKTVDFLDVRLDLTNNKYQPYRKPNSETVHINNHSNHSPNILKELPKAINKQITSISCDQNIFDTAKSTHEQALS